MTSDVSAEQYINEQIPIFVTEFGISIEDKLSHAKNAASSIVFKELGKVTEVNPLQAWKEP